ncbi:two pore potassium channel c-like [Canna indica]|uniref:Two pore potassium channel c-like n=1 Tax=Canna indica TaxID=4628 RepID=A0AAQ3JM75_9LILI|nr:two pore potassium channel c-like [Canna indica]
MDKLSISNKTPPSQENSSLDPSNYHNSNSSFLFSYFTSASNSTPQDHSPLIIKELNEHSNTTSRGSHSAPSIFTHVKESSAPASVGSSTGAVPSSIVKQAVLGVILYLLIGVAVYVLRNRSFKGHKTSPLVDGLYFTVVSLSTAGYGDIVPHTHFSKLFVCAFILVGFGFVDILLSGVLTYVLDRQEAVLLSAMDENRGDAMLRKYVIDVSKGRMRVRMKVGLALGVVIGCIAVGALMAHVLEGLCWLDSFYLSMTSVTTVGYGDYAFLTMKGRVFASVWLPVSTLAVAKAFLYLTELRIDKRNRRTAEWVLKRKMTAGDLMAADLDNNGSISKSEYVIYKLKEMGKIMDKDILLICNQFDKLDTGNCGKITLSDLIQNHH